MIFTSCLIIVQQSSKFFYKIQLKEETYMAAGRCRVVHLVIIWLLISKTLHSEWSTNIEPVTSIQIFSRKTDKKKQRKI